MTIFAETWESSDGRFRYMHKNGLCIRKSKIILIVKLQSMYNLDIEYITDSNIMANKYQKMHYVQLQQIKTTDKQLFKFILNISITKEYQYRNKCNLKTLPANHLGKLGELKFDFVEYKAHQLIACHLYERMTVHCMNQYGLFKDFYRPECLDAKYYFKTCVELNAAYGLQKKYFPEHFVGSHYSRPMPQFSQLAL